MRDTYVHIALMAALGLAGSSSSRADSGLYKIGGTCTTLNCGSSVVQGTIKSSVSGYDNPITLSLLSYPGVCMRVDIPASKTQATLVSPSGRIWYNGGRPYPDLRPLIIANTDAGGYYTLVIGRAPLPTGNPAPATSDLNVYVYYGVYTLDNPNCGSPTLPFVATPGNR